MSKIKDGGPAFPIPLNHGEQWQGMAPFDGMTLRQYAAIKLKVPNSGLDWLDDMIRESLRDDLAGRALPVIMDQKDVHDGRENVNAAWMAYRLADAMLKARENKE